MIQQDNLIEFYKSHSDFAEYTYDCDATGFIDNETDIDWKTDKATRTYKFKSFYLNYNNFSYYPSYPYQVLSISDKSYLMYEVEEEEGIFIWVCYTEPKYRNNGYMSKLLKHLTDIYPDIKITIHTFNQSLRNSSSKVGIELFPG